MLIPLSWLKEYVDIKMPFPELALKMSSAGLTIEKWEEKDGDIIFDPEVTPNRPDWLSVYGIAREISAVTGAKLKPIPENLQTAKLQTRGQKLPIIIKPNYDIVPRIATVIIKGVKVKSSPDWLQKRIKQIGLRPINNLVDITNFVLWTYGSLLHSFDYDRIRGHQMVVDLSKGGEDFRSLDGINYKLPKNSIIIKDVGRIIDLLPLKGGENTATFTDTKNILLHSVVVDPILTRRTSQSLGLRSDSSAIAEKGLDPNGAIIALNFALKLILDLAGGEIASDLLDSKEKEFESWTVELRHEKLEKVLGIPIDSKNVMSIFERLELTPKSSNGTYSVEIPTFRPDLKIEEDLIEEIGRIIGYNNFPKTLPASPMPTHKVAFAKDYDFETRVKQVLISAGLAEIYTYSLVSESDLKQQEIDPAKNLRIKNPISRDYEYLRPTLLGNLLKAVKQNLPNFQNIKLFELGKVYKGENLNKFSEEYALTGVSSGEKFYETKGLVEKLLSDLNIPFDIEASEVNSPLMHAGRSAQVKSGKETIGFVGELNPGLLIKYGIKEHITAWSLNFDSIEKLARPGVKFHPIPKYPAVFEDVTIIIPETVTFRDVVHAIKDTSRLIENIAIVDTHEDNKTLRLTYQDSSKNLTEKEVSEVRGKFLKKLKELGVKEK